MRDTTIRDREIRLLTDLVRELVRRGLRVGVSDAGAAAFILSAEGRIVLVVAVKKNHFEWCRGDDVHPVTDPAEAAAAMAAEVRLRTEDA